MPILPLFRPDGGFVDDADGRLLALMLHPHDTVARRQAYAALRLGAEHRPLPQMQAQMAGDLLVLVGHLAQQERAPSASLKRAMLLYCREHATKRDGRGKPMRTSETNLKRAWRAYMPVAHLWAAWRRSVRALGAEGEASLIAFLGIAERYRAFGEQHRVLMYQSRQRLGAPLLDPASTWKLPALASIEAAPVEVMATLPGSRYDEFLPAQ